MDIRGKIGAFGGFMAIAGIVSSVMYMFNYNLRILGWVDMWGSGVGWLIRIGLIVGGAAIFFLLGRGRE